MTKSGPVAWADPVMLQTGDIGNGDAACYSLMRRNIQSPVDFGVDRENGACKRKRSCEGIAGRD